MLPRARLVCARGTAQWKMANTNINLCFETTACDFFAKLYLLPINVNRPVVVKL